MKRLNILVIIEMLRSFDYEAAENSRILILGSMPGKKSLDEQEYYAHPRNIFWDIMGNILSFSRGNITYKERLEILKNKRIALWDVVGVCRRTGSLDSNIDNSSIVYNDFEYFFDKFRKIEYIIFNGRKAESLFMKHFSYPKLEALKNMKYYLMPSTSPANASIKKQDKIEAWLSIKSLLDF
jgi:double-stranded uracil-DNA glycosylase